MSDDNTVLLGQAVLILVSKPEYRERKQVGYPFFNIEAVLVKEGMSLRDYNKPLIHLLRYLL